MADTTSTLPPALRARLEKRGILNSSNSSITDKKNNTGNTAVESKTESQETGATNDKEATDTAPLPPHWQQLVDPNTYGVFLT